MDRGEDQVHDFDHGLFDRLPDHIVLSIFNRLHDARSLCLSMSVCKRFHYMVGQVDEVFLSVPRKLAADRAREEEIASKMGFKNLVVRTIMRLKPICFVSQMMKPRSRNEAKLGRECCFYYVPGEILKPFQEIRRLHLRLPGHKGAQKLGSKMGNSTTFLKWEADFGSHLRSCVILGAKSWAEKGEKDENSPETGRGPEQESRVMAEDELKLRIVWTLSCLIAASARHYLIQETVRSRRAIESVEVSDEIDQGRIRMNREQIEEMRDRKGSDEGATASASAPEFRSKMPALRMKMWYAEKLELPGFGKVMEGATLVVVRPAGGRERERERSNADLVAAAFGGDGEERLVEFARKLVLANKCLTLEMNSL